jgi:hypothetical protein
LPEYVAEKSDFRPDRLPCGPHQWVVLLTAHVSVELRFPPFPVIEETVQDGCCPLDFARRDQFHPIGDDLDKNRSPVRDASAGTVPELWKKETRD